MTPNIADIIRRHVSLEVRCIDRMYLHAYMPKLQTSGGLCFNRYDVSLRRCLGRTVHRETPLLCQMDWSLRFAGAARRSVG